jgi:anti-sigma factor RsiW
VVELLNAYLDGSLLGDEREEVERHLVTCDGCQAFLAQLRVSVGLTATLREHDVPEPVMGALLDAFRRR